MTQNIPSRFPDFVTPQDRKQILKWIKERPEHHLDYCANSGCRWTYQYTDHGMWSHILIFDNAFKKDPSAKLEVDPGDPANW